MTQTFSVQIHGYEIHCQIGSSTALKAPVFCFSIMKEPRVISGGTLVRQVAGYAEIALPDIPAGGKHSVVIAYAAANHRPRNRAWLPLGPYIRVGKNCLPLPPGSDLGVRPAVPKPAPLLAQNTLPLVPPPKTWIPSSGMLDVRSLSPHKSLSAVDALAKRLNLEPLQSQSGTKTTIIEDAAFQSEHYRISIEETGITIVAGSKHGIHNAAITLLMLRETLDGRLPCGVIEDEPRFSWRGQHLDCARHYFGVESILRLMDAMALFKLNRFHWHFADDEAFRLEVDCAPELWQKTAYRGEGEAVPGVFGGGIRSGGSYSKADVKRILARAAELNIEVLPEIEVPAHSHAMNKAVSGLRDPGDNGGEKSIQDYLDNIINPAVPKTWGFLEMLTDELATVFPMRVLHLGCDELPPDAWSGSPAVSNLKRREKLQSSHDVQGWMMEKLARQLASKGIRSAAWEEAAKGSNGGIGNNALLFSWTGQGPGLEAARRGHDVVMCPAPHTYFDHTHTDDIDDWGATWSGIVPLESTVDWDPVPSGAEDIAHRIIGVEACFWSEFTTHDDKMEPMLAPRLLGLACKAWETDRKTSVRQLQALAGAHAKLFQRIGWNAHQLWRSTQT
jgi:hexosaminidase